MLSVVLAITIGFGNYNFMAYVPVCKSCIVKCLQSSKHCPQCSLKIHETQPLMNLKPDRVMQDIVFKLVPNLYEGKITDCLKRRRIVEGVKKAISLKCNFIIASVVHHQMYAVVMITVCANLDKKNV